MGVTITPAALQVVNMMFAETTLTQIKQMPALEQTQVTCDLVNHTDTPICRTTSSFGTNVKLGFWYQLSEWMKQGIVAPIPKDYKLSAKVSDLLQAIRHLEGGQQLTVFQDVVVNMGYSPIGGTAKIQEPVNPQETAPRTKVKIQGINNTTVLIYIDNMNTFDFQAATPSFVEESVLKTPIQEPSVGQESILAYMRADCYGLSLSEG